MRRKILQLLEIALIKEYNKSVSMRDGMSHFETYICSSTLLPKKEPVLHDMNNRLDSGMEIEIKYYKIVIFIMRNAAWFGRLRQKG